MTKQILTAFVALLSLNSVGKAFAFAMPSSKPLPQIINESDLIAIASVTRYQPSVSRSGPANEPPNPIVHLGPDIFTSMPMVPAGHYSFRTVQPIKGEMPAAISIDLPYILSMYYGSAELSIRDGSKIILFLQRDAEGKLAPTDPTVPFIPLSDGASTAKHDSIDPQQEVCDLMVASCTDAALRQAETYLLRNVASPNIVAELFPYINDTDMATRDNVLICMTTNQQVAAIPLIAKLDANLEEQGGGAQSVIALSNFQTKEAVPYLNCILNLLV